MLVNMAGVRSYLILFVAVLVVAIESVPQVPYDYIPLGRRHDGQPVAVAPHPGDVNLVYEKLFPSRRKWLK